MSTSHRAAAGRIIYFKLVAAPTPEATSSVHKEKEFESRSVWNNERVFSASYKINLLCKV